MLIEQTPMVGHFMSKTFKDRQSSSQINYTPLTFLQCFVSFNRYGCPQTIHLSSKL